jgi:Zn-finger nucleic acid-binding protein
VAFRDGFEKCPRCGVELVDARSARGCPACGGMWVEEAVLQEMVLEMLPPGPLKRLQLAVMQRSEAPIACPSCQKPMHQARISHVVLDRCPKHGVWFDKQELGTALLRVGLDADVLVEVSERDGIASPPADVTMLTFQIATPGRTVHEVTHCQEIVKIGRLKSAQVYVDDPRVAHMHAIIDCSANKAVLIDLGSADGTTVNGVRITKHPLVSGDQILVGVTTISVRIDS